MPLCLCKHAFIGLLDSSSTFPAFLFATAGVNSESSLAYDITQFSCRFSIGNQGKIKLTLSGFGKIAPDGVDTAVLLWVTLDMFDVFKPVLRLIIPIFFVESRSGSRSILVAIFFSIYNGQV